MATILEPNPINPNRRHIELAAAALEADLLIAHPTDTTYALACHVQNVKGIERLYAMKKKSLARPLSYICAEIKHIAEFAAVSQRAYRAMREVLPGPYTFILPARRSAPRPTQTKHKTIGLRIPASEVCRVLVERIGLPILSTSANREGEIFTTAEEIRDAWGHDLEFILDVGPIPAEPSTIISFENETPEVIRVGKGPIIEM
jgi:tRNA threonylcarbamoyl adenosine modification protein (Sua5/YciO/YrdC/YwlC family)